MEPDRCCYFLEILLAILCPPIGVLLHFGCSIEFCISFALTFFFYIPGLIYAIYVLVTDFSNRRERDYYDDLA